MKLISGISIKQIVIPSFLFFLAVPVRMSAQEKISIGIHCDPLISWFGTDIDAVNNDGARPGINAGLTFNMPFSPNYSFSTGLNLINAAGRLVSDSETQLELVKTETVAANEPVLYKIQYVSVPLGLKLETNQIGYLTFFSDVGMDPKVMIGGKADIPSLEIKGEKANNELKLFNLAYHFMAGVEYGIGGNTSAVAGIGFENNFLDVTKDNGSQPVDKVTQKMIYIRLGINF
jgi:Outer membrane protein beta-barrel domain